MADLMDAVMQNNRHVADNIDAWGALYDNAKVADAMVKANPDLVQRMGFQDPKQFHTLSAQDKIAATTGYIKQQGVQEHIAQLQAYQDASAQHQQQVQDDQSVGTFLQNYGQAPAADAQGQPLTPTQKLQWALSNTPGMSGRTVPRAIQALGEWQRATASEDGPSRAGTVTPIPGVPSKSFVWQTDKSGTPIDTPQPGAATEIPPKPTVPAEPGFAWRWNGKDWQMAQTMPGNLPPATASKLDSLTAQEQSLLTELATPYKPGWFDEKPEARTKRLEAALKGIQTRKALLLDPRGGTSAEAPAGTRRYNPETGLIE